MYCIVDLETTGGKGNRATEIAMLKFDGEKIVDEFTALINPECSIPPFITQLTGITNEMVKDAPKFYQVAKEIVEFLEGTIFVAHNVFFDFNVLKNEFKELGYDFKIEKLCTVRLARANIPGHASYSLGRICAELGIKIEGRHRAMGDALATVELFKRILAVKPIAEVNKQKIGTRELALPSRLNTSAIENAPHEAGVYYLKDEKGVVLYVGKSNDIRKRLMQHFRVDLKRKKDVELKNAVAEIDYEITYNELAALVLEAYEIKRLRPLHNRALNRVRFRYGLEMRIQKGVAEAYVTTHISEDHNNALLFKSKKTAEQALAQVYKDQFGLEYASQFFKGQLAKLQQVLGVEKFNSKLAEWFDKFEYQESDQVYHIGQVDFQLEGGKLTSIRVTHNEEEKHYKVDEDPDIKRIFLNHLKQRNVAALGVQVEH